MNSTHNLIAENTQLKQRIKLLEEMLRLKNQKQFGASSEKADDSQGQLFNEAEEDMFSEPLDDNAEIVVPTHTRKKKKRVSIPADLPREEIIHDLADDEKFCPHDGHALKHIGDETSEQLDIEPAKVKVLHHIRRKYACPCCEKHLVTAKKPPQPIAKSIAAPGLLAHITIRKYMDALPLYRQVTIFKRIGVELDRGTLANWMIKMGQLVQSLINRMLEHCCAQNVLQMDETPLQVLNEPGKTAQSKSYMWVLSMTHAHRPVVLFQYSASRGAETPSLLLEDFSGALMVDGYNGYQPLCDENKLIRLGCWAHARRKFVEAQRTEPNGKNGRANSAVNFIKQLYRIEKLSREMSVEQRYALRQERAKPVLDKLRQWLDETQPKVPPQSTLGKALAYLNNQWSRLIHYVEDGGYPIDNNRAENAIRPFVIGRKNWLFANSQAGAHASANLYSLIESAKANGLEPYAYLKILFTELPKAQVLEDVDALLPWNVEGVLG